MNSCLRKEKDNGVVLEGNFLSQSNANSWKITWAICEANDSIHIEMIACIPKLVPSAPGDRRCCTHFVVWMYFCKLLILECKFCGTGSHMRLPDRPAQCAGYMPRRFSRTSNFANSDLCGSTFEAKPLAHKGTLQWTSSRVTHKLVI